VNGGPGESGENPGALPVKPGGAISFSSFAVSDVGQPDATQLKDMNANGQPLGQRLREKAGYQDRGSRGRGARRPHPAPG
jgi:hypothetical protein